MEEEVVVSIVLVVVGVEVKEGSDQTFLKMMMVVW